MFYFFLLIKRRWMNFLWIVSLSILIPFLFMDIVNWKISDIAIVFAISIFTTSFLWIGTNFWFSWIRKHIPWEKSPPRHLLSTIFPLLFFISIIFALAVIIIDLSLSVTMSVSNIYRSSIVTIIFTIVFTSIYEGRYIYRKWKLSELRLSLLAKDALSTKLDEIKKQIDPHFLFNSLSVLTSLIESDKTLAIQFVQELARVYRYILKYSDKHFISLGQEIKCLDAYIFLLRQRYYKGFEFKNKITSLYYDYWIPPFTLQILMENAIKHNKLNRNSPLQISLSIKQGQLIFKNELKPVKHQVPSTKVGLKNLFSRYQLLISEEPVIQKTKSFFMVYIPLMKEKIF